MQKELIENNPILKMSIDFSLLVLDYCHKLEKLRKYATSRQLIKSGTSISANCMEAQNAESKADFFHKIKIASKKAYETQYWLILSERLSIYPLMTQLPEKLIEIQKVIKKILGTAKRKPPFSYILNYFIF